MRTKLIGASCVLVLLSTGSAAPAGAHRSACHLRHACPSDHGTYTWRGQRCWKAPHARTHVVRYGGRRYYCRSARASAAGRRLYLKQARAVTARIALNDIREERDYPEYVSTTKPVCKRLSARHATCDYTVMHEGGTNPNQHQASSTCKRRVDVRLRRGARRPVGRLLDLNCSLNRNPDYEP